MVNAISMSMAPTTVPWKKKYSVRSREICRATAHCGGSHVQVVVCNYSHLHYYSQRYVSPGDKRASTAQAW